MAQKTPSILGIIQSIFLLIYIAASLLGFCQASNQFRLLKQTELIPSEEHHSSRIRSSGTPLGYKQYNNKGIQLRYRDNNSQSQQKSQTQQLHQKYARGLLVGAVLLVAFICLVAFCTIRLHYQRCYSARNAQYEVEQFGNLEQGRSKSMSIDEALAKLNVQQFSSSIQYGFQKNDNSVPKDTKYSLQEHLSSSCFQQQHVQDTGWSYQKQTLSQLNNQNEQQQLILKRCFSGPLLQNSNDFLIQQECSQLTQQPTSIQSCAGKDVGPGQNEWDSSQWVTSEYYGHHSCLDRLKLQLERSKALELYINRFGNIEYIKATSQPTAIKYSTYKHISGQYSTAYRDKIYTDQLSETQQCLPNSIMADIRQQQSCCGNWKSRRKCSLDADEYMYKQDGQNLCKNLFDSERSSILNNQRSTCILSQQTQLKELLQYTDRAQTDEQLNNCFGNSEDSIYKFPRLKHNKIKINYLLNGCKGLKDSKQGSMSSFKSESRSCTPCTEVGSPQHAQYDSTVFNSLSIHDEYSNSRCVSRSDGSSENGESSRLTRTSQSVGQVQGSQEGISCPICLEDFVAGEEVVVLDCGHIFKVDCFKLHMQRSRKVRTVRCPYCRAPVFSQLKHPEPTASLPETVDSNLPV